MDLPTLNFAKWSNGDASQRLEFANSLADSFKKHGFVKIINHGVPDEHIRELFGWSKRYFKMPIEAKEKSRMKLSPGPQRGWIPYGIEKTSGLARIHNQAPKIAEEQLTDQRESFDTGPPNDHQYPNLWPEEADLPGFRSFMEVYFRNCQALCLQIISATEIGLNVPPGVLVNRCLHDASELRFNYYPSSSVKSLSTGTSKRSWPHTDFGIITLLFQDAVGGLELEDRRNPGSFVPVVSSSSGSLTELIVNTADCLTRWTNNVIRAGLHQVNLPVHMKQMKDGTVPDRYTCPFFLKAGYGTSVGPVPAFISQKQLAAYDEITAIEYHKQRIMVVYEGVPTTEVGASGASPNGSSADGVSGVKPNAFSANGIHSERVEAYGVEVNGLKVDGVEANGVKANEIEAN